MDMFSLPLNKICFADSADATPTHLRHLGKPGCLTPIYATREMINDAKVLSNVSELSSMILVSTTT
jgi:hypothetical protein